MNITDDNRNLYSLLERLGVDPSEFEVDLSDFTLDKPTKDFFEQIAGLLRCKLQMDGKYEKVGTGKLTEPEYKSFGKRAKQEGDKVMTVDQVWNDAKAKKAAFEDLLKTVVTELHMDPKKEILVDGAPIKTTFFGNYQVLTLAPLKKKERCREKTEDDYDSNAKFLCDVGRATIVCDSEDQIVSVFEKLKEKSNVIRMKNRFSRPIYTGTRDLLLNIKVEGHVFEVQVHLADLLAVHKRSKAHDYYAYFRKYFVGTAESYEKRAELFRNLGEAILNSNSSISDGIRAILESKDKTKLQALWTITHREIFASDALNLKACKRRVSLLLKTGGDTEDLLGFLHDMATVYYSQGKYEKALQWLQRALEGMEATLGSDHPSTLETIDTMAAVYYSQGKYKKALIWYKRALDGRESKLGSDHPSTLDTVHNMAVVYNAQGKYVKALEWYQRTLQGKEVALGKDHPDTLNTVNNIGLVYYHQGEHVKALQWYQRALQGKEAALGKDHPSTLDTVNSIGLVYYHQGNYDKALEWYQRALEGYEAALGKDHPHTLTTVNNMAAVYDNQGEYVKALEWYQRALQGEEAALGKDHPSTLDTVNNIGLVYNNKGNYEKALEWYQRALQGKEAALGKDHPRTLDTVNNIGATYLNLEYYEKALEWFQRALNGYEENLGSDHPSTLMSVHNIGLVYDNQGEYVKALEWYQRALDGKKATLGRYHPSTQITQRAIDQANYEKTSLKFRRRAPDRYKANRRRDHRNTLGTINNMATVHNDQGKYNKGHPKAMRVLQLFSYLAIVVVAAVLACYDLSRFEPG